MKVINVLDTRLHDALKRLMGQALPIKTSLTLKKISDEIAAEITLFESTRHKLLAELSLKDEDGNAMTDSDGQVKMSQDNRDIVVAKLEEILNSEVALTKLSVDMLAEARISADDLVLIDQILD
jgi:hypothetical protein